MGGGDPPRPHRMACFALALETPFYSTGSTTYLYCIRSEYALFNLSMCGFTSIVSPCMGGATKTSALLNTYRIFYRACRYTCTLRSGLRAHRHFNK